MIGTIATVIAMTGAPTSSELTIYNQGFGLVKEVRSMNLKEGRQTVAVEDVASMIDPSSVAFRSLTDKNSLNVLEQNYQFDLISPMAILNKSVGQKIRFVRMNGTTREVLEGTLISAPTAIVTDEDGDHTQTYNGMVIRTDDGRIILNPKGEIEVSTVPAGLISKPTLLWDLESTRAGDNTVELSYITRGMRWNADYVFTLDGTGKGDLQGWVTIDNQSGATWHNAKLKLLAGDVNQVPSGRPEMAMDAVKATMRSSAGGFQEEGLFEYHLYTLQRPATVANREIKQLSLLEGFGVPVQKKLIVDSMQRFGRYMPSEGEVGTGDISPQVRIEFDNTEASKLGVPLPEGRVRVYQRDKSGSVQLLGEDHIEHTPKNDSLSLVVGRSFDVKASRKRTNFQRINDRTVQETFEVEIRNRKDLPETVYVLERRFGDWRVLSESQAHTKLTAETMQYVVKIGANEVKKVTYTVQTKW